MVSEETLRYARIALAAYQKSGNLIKIGWAQYNLGFYYLWLGDLDEAEAQMQAALAMAEQTGDVMAQSHCLTFLAIAKRKRGQVEETRRSSERSLQMATATQRPEYIGTARANLAWVAWRAGKLSEAQVLGRAALELWQQTPLVYPFQWTALCPLIGVALAQDQLSEAIAYARALLTPEQQRLPGSLATPLEAALHAWDSDQPDVARTQLQQATAPAQELGYL